MEFRNSVATTLVTCVQLCDFPCVLHSTVLCGCKAKFSLVISFLNPVMPLLRRKNHLEWLLYWLLTAAITAARQYCCDQE